MTDRKNFKTALIKRNASINSPERHVVHGVRKICPRTGSRKGQLKGGHPSAKTVAGNDRWGAAVGETNQLGPAGGLDMKAHVCSFQDNRASGERVEQGLASGIQEGSVLRTSHGDVLEEGECHQSQVAGCSVPSTRKVGYADS
jgi:hypothetical protein